MDSLTQMVLGAAVGEKVLGRKVGNKAMLYGAIAGTIPDLDTFAGKFTDTVSAIEFHRGVSHSVVFAIVAAPIFGWLISRWEKKATRKDWTKLMFWGLITHPILDSFTTWGTQLFWPMKKELAFKNIFVIDPMYTLPFLIFLLMAMRQPKNSDRRRKYNNIGLIVSTSYLVLTLGLKGITYQKFVDSLETQGIFYDRIDTKPAPFNSILWTANVETEQDYLIGSYSLFDSREVIDFKAFPKNHEYLGSLEEHPKVKRLVDIAKGWYVITEENGQLYFNDLRFGQINPYQQDSPFTFKYLLEQQDDQLKVIEVKKRPEEVGKMLSDLWERIKGN